MGRGPRTGPAEIPPRHRAPTPRRRPNGPPDAWSGLPGAGHVVTNVSWRPIARTRRVRRSALTPAWRRSRQGLCRSGNRVRMRCVRAGAAGDVIDAGRPAARDGLRSAGPVPGDGPLTTVAVTGDGVRQR